MTTSTFDDNEILQLAVPSDRPESALRCLMRDWERDGVVDEDESETELMVLLSEMVRVSNPTASDT